MNPLVIRSSKANLDGKDFQSALFLYASILPKSGNISLEKVFLWIDADMQRKCRKYVVGYFIPRNFIDR